MPDRPQASDLADAVESARAAARHAKRVVANGYPAEAAEYLVPASVALAKITVKACKLDPKLDPTGWGVKGLEAGLRLTLDYPMSSCDAAAEVNAADISIGICAFLLGF